MRWVYLIFFLSGGAGLAYQVVWTRLLTEIFGVTVHAVTTVLATFLAGLALGAFLIGRAAQRSGSPLRLYGWMEIGIGAASLLGLAVMAWLEPAYLWAANRFATHSASMMAVRFLLGAIVILPPTILMGGTLPVITRHMVRQFGRLGRELSLLYALNTCGAVVGTLASGFWLIRAFGLHGTLYLAVGLNLAIGVAALRMKAAEADQAGAPSPARERKKSAVRVRGVGRGLLVVMLLSGFASLGFEVFWTRILVLVVGTNAYAFVTMLATFLVGITLGSLLARTFVDRVADLRRAFGWVQIGIAVSTCASLFLLARVGIEDAQQWMVQLLDNWVALVAARFGLCFAVMLVPAVLIGATFPMAGKIWTLNVGTISRDVGQVYGANTAGNILGAAVTGFVLLPALGLQKGIAALVILNLMCALWAFWPVSAPAGVRVRARLVRTLPSVLGVGVCIVLLVAWTPRPFRMLSERPDDKTLYYREGIVATVKVVQRAANSDFRLMGVDAVKIGQSGGGVDAKQQALAHFPFLLMRESPRDVLSIGLGSGILISEVARHPGLSTVECVEISPSVIEGAAFFSDLNGDVLNNPLVRIIEDDGFNYLQRTAKRYDAIISDAKSRTGHAGNAIFYSVDYYRLCHDHLGDTGLMIQWIPMNVPPSEFAMIVRGYLGVFEHVYAWSAPPYDLYLVGTKRPLALDLGHIQSQLDSPILDDLGRYGWEDAEGFVSFLMAGSDALREAVGDGPLNTLERPLLEYYNLKDFAEPLNRCAMSNAALLTDARRFPPNGVRFVSSEPDTAERDRAESAYRSTTELLAGMVQARRALAFGEDADGASLKSGLDRMEQALADQPNAAMRYTAADTYVALSRRPVGAETIAYARRAHALWPAYPGLAGQLRLMLREYHKPVQATYERARQLSKQNRPRQAVEAFRQVLEVDPEWAEARLNLGNTLAKLGDYAEAVESYRAALRVEPNLTPAYGALGTALDLLDRDAEAVASYRKALALRPNWPLVQDRLARLLASSPETSVRDGAMAVQIAERLCRATNDGVARYLDTLAMAYAEVGQFDQATNAGRRALKLLANPGQAQLREQIQSRLSVYEAGRPYRKGEPAVSSGARSKQNNAG